MLIACRLGDGRAGSRVELAVDSKTETRPSRRTSVGAGVAAQPAALGRGLGGRGVVQVELGRGDDVVVVAVVDRSTSCGHLPGPQFSIDRAEVAGRKLAADVLDVVRELVAVEHVLVVGAAGAGDADPLSPEVSLAHAASVVELEAEVLGRACSGRRGSRPGAPSRPRLSPAPATAPRRRPRARRCGAPAARGRPARRSGRCRSGPRRDRGERLVPDVGRVRVQRGQRAGPARRRRAGAGASARASASARAAAAPGRARAPATR